MAARVRATGYVYWPLLRTTSEHVTVQFHPPHGADIPL